MKLLPVPAFDDNYIWLLHDGCSALVVDPGDAAPVLQALSTQGLTLRSILVTHHHADHVGGLAELKRTTGATVYGPAAESIDHLDHRVAQPDTVQALGVNWQVLDVPGHTAGHIAFYADAVDGDDAARYPVLFCGDTLFSAGCGRLFEGTPAQMLHSLDTLAALPDDTRVCCAHEYTLSNLRFACAVEPDNAALQTHVAWAQAQRQQGKPTLPTRIAQERSINPFLRSREATVRQSVRRHDPQLAADANDADVFAALRRWKNTFK